MLAKLGMHLHCEHLLADSAGTHYTNSQGKLQRKRTKLAGRTSYQPVSQMHQIDWAKMSAKQPLSDWYAADYSETNTVHASNLTAAPVCSISGKYILPSIPSGTVNI